jgi:hypothetical protein
LPCPDPSLASYLACVATLFLPGKEKENPSNCKDQLKKNQFQNGKRCTCYGYQYWLEKSKKTQKKKLVH